MPTLLIAFIHSVQNNIWRKLFHILIGQTSFEFFLKFILTQWFPADEKYLHLTLLHFQGIPVSIKSLTASHPSLVPRQVIYQNEQEETKQSE